MVVVPAATPVAVVRVPVPGDTVAAEGFEEVQVAPCALPVVPFSYTAVATNI